MRDAAGWFSSLVGRKASLSPLLQRLDEAGAVHVRTTELAQGAELGAPTCNVLPFTEP